MSACTFRVVACAAIACFAGQAHAQGDIPPTDEITRKVSAAADHYIAAISCESGGVAAKDIAALTPYGFYEGDRQPAATYAVPWTGDIGCMGGSGTVSSNILVVRVGPTPAFLVDVGASSPVVRFDVPVKYVDKLVGNTVDSLVLEGWDFGPNDASCCPSVRKRFTMHVDEKGNWTLVKQRTIGNRPPPP